VAAASSPDSLRGHAGIAEIGGDDYIMRTKIVFRTISAKRVVADKI
jgi:hypothetical protein